MHEQNSAQPLPDYQFVFSVAVEFIVLAISVAIGYWRNIAWFNHLGDWKSWLVGGGAGLLFAFLSTLILRSLINVAYAPACEYYRQVSTMMRKFSFWQCLILAALSGFCEELFFRGVLVPLLGVIISSLIFTAMHYNGSKLWLWTILILLVGLSLGYCYQAFQDLGLVISFHAINNLFSFNVLRYYRFTDPDQTANS